MLLFLAYQCEVPEVAHGSTNPSAASMLDTGESFVLDCNTGFTIDGGTAMTCLPDQTFGNVSVCIGEICGGPLFFPNVPLLVLWCHELDNMFTTQLPIRQLPIDH